VAKGSVTPFGTHPVRQRGIVLLYQTDPVKCPRLLYNRTAPALRAANPLPETTHPQTEPVAWATAYRSENDGLIRDVEEWLDQQGR
jgi:hypothetical protein